MDNFKLNPDLLLNLKHGQWFATNPRMRTHVGLGVETFKALSELNGSIDREKLIAALENGTAFDGTQRFIGHKGLVEDHSGFKSAEDNQVTGEELVELLIKRNILIKDDEDGLEYEKAMSNLFDMKNLGSFHQRVGQYVLLERRSKEPWRDWQNQKFSEDGKSLLETSYKKIQEPFFDAFFTRERVGGKKILDFGCGNGYYTAKLAVNGANVTGLDNSPELLELANKNFSNQENLQCDKTDTFDDVVSYLEKWEDDSVDMILLQDTILLLINPENTSEAPDLLKLLKAFKRVLKKDGVLHAMEPNPVFWLCSRMGNEAKPYSIVTEYHKPIFNVSPSLDVFTGHMSSGGFALKKLEHPWPVDKSDKQFNFQSEFPVWNFYTFIKF